MLNEDQRREFETRGITRISGALGAADCRRIEDLLWDALGASGIRRGEPATWTKERVTGFQSLTQAGAFDALGKGAIPEAIDELLGTGRWEREPRWGAPLIAAPGMRGPWTVPHQSWHLDFLASPPADRLAGVRILAFVGAVEPGGGGTVVIAGSHRLVARRVAEHPQASARSADVRKALMREHPWLGTLGTDGPADERIRRFMEEGTAVDGIELRVVELTGARGDAILMHPWTFHAAAPNCSGVPRLMLSHSVFRKGLTRS